MAASGDVQFNTINVDGPGLWDYNLYFSTGTYEYGYFTSKTTGARMSSTLAGWKAAMSVACEAHAQDHMKSTFVASGAGANFYKLQSGSPAINAGKSNGTSGGTTCDMGAWGNGAPSIIGSSLVTGGSTPPTQVPEAPSLTVS